MKFKYQVTALLCAVWVAFLPALCLAQIPATQDSDPSTGLLFGRVGVYDANKNLYSTDPLVNASTIIPHYTNRPIAAGATDSSLVPVNLYGFRVLVARFRDRQSSLATGASIEFAMRSHSVAILDSTQGAFFPLGKGALRRGKTVALEGQADRNQTIVLADSVTGIAFQSYYGSLWIKNNTGADMKYDLWFEGFR